MEENDFNGKNWDEKMDKIQRDLDEKIDKRKEISNDNELDSSLREVRRKYITLDDNDLKERSYYTISELIVNGDIDIFEENNLDDSMINQYWLYEKDEFILKDLEKSMDLLDSHNGKKEKIIKLKNLYQKEIKISIYGEPLVTKINNLFDKYTEE